MKDKEFVNRLLSIKGELNRPALEAFVGDLQGERDLLREAMQGMTEGIAVVAPAGLIRFCNPAFRQLLGIPGGDLRDRALGPLLIGSPVAAVYQQAHTRNARIVRRELVQERPVRRILLTSAFPLGAADDGERHVALVLQDITDWREQEQRLHRAEQQAALTTMSATMAHELRNPLNSLSIHIQLLERALRKGGWEGDMEPLDVVKEEIRRLNDVLEDFLSAARPTKPRFERTDARSILTSALDLLQPEIEANKVDVVVEEPDQWPTLMVDGHQLRRVMINLVKNAIESMPDGGNLTISVRSTRSQLVLQFCDNGRGMTREELARMFEPYYTTKRTGTGLGLVAVERIVREHDGHIEYKSIPGAGTTATLSIPHTPRTQRLLTSSATRSATTAEDND